MYNKLLKFQEARRLAFRIEVITKFLRQVETYLWIGLGVSPVQYLRIRNIFRVYSESVVETRKGEQELFWRTRITWETRAATKCLHSVFPIKSDRNTEKLIFISSGKYSGIENYYIFLLSIKCKGSSLKLYYCQQFQCCLCDSIDFPTILCVFLYKLPASSVFWRQIVEKTTARETLNYSAWKLPFKMFAPVLSLRGHPKENTGETVLVKLQAL